MDFMKLTNPEYKNTRKQLIWRSTFIHIWRGKGARWFYLFFLLLGLVPVVIAYFDPAYSIFEMLFMSFLFVFGVALAILTLTLCLVLHRKWHYNKFNREFVAKTKRLTKDQTELLLSEYPNRKKIKIYYDRKKTTLGSAAIYVTDNFLFIPGLLLIIRDELKEIKITQLYVDFSPMGTPPDSRAGKGLINIKSITRIEFFRIGAPSIRSPLWEYRYHRSPETVEQIMAWFWQCGADDPRLSERTKALIHRSFG